MSRFTVVSSPEADADLVAIWSSASDRKQITEASDAADRLLAKGPATPSVYLAETLWKLDVPPLRFYFAVRDEDRVIEITNVMQLEE